MKWQGMQEERKCTYNRSLEDNSLWRDERLDRLRELHRLSTWNLKIQLRPFRVGVWITLFWIMMIYLMVGVDNCLDSPRNEETQASNCCMQLLFWLVSSHHLCYMDSDTSIRYGYVSKGLTLLSSKI